MKDFFSKAFQTLTAPIRFVAGFFEQDAPQSSTRLAALAYVGASIVYAFRDTPDPIILGTLVGTAAAFCGIKLAKDVQLAKIAATAPGATAVVTSVTTS